MKVAEALVLRADHQRRLEELKQRLIRNAKVQEGDRPAEDPQELLKQFESLASELISLIQRINRTNTTSRFGDGSLTDALAHRDVLRLRQVVYRELAQAASVVQSRVSKSEVKFKSSVDVAEMQKRADVIAKDHRELDARIQEANWRIDLIE